MPFIDFFRGNAALLTTYWWQFATVLLLGMALAALWSRRTISNKDSEMGIWKARAQEYEAKLRGASPNEAAKELVDLRARLEALEPYGLSNDRAKAMLDVLKKSTPAGIYITLDSTASDALHLFDQVCGVFQQTRWALQAQKGLIGPDKPPDCGLTLIRHFENSDEVIATIRAALDAAHLDFEEVTDASGTPMMTVPQLMFSSRDRNYVPKARWA